MSALRRAAACLILACPLALSPAPAVRASGSPMVDKINDARRANRLPPLRYSASLARSSRRFSRHLLRTGTLAHARRIHASGRFSRLGEVLALNGGWKPWPDRALGEWLGSPTHRAVLLSTGFRYVGAAGVRGRFHRRRAVIWTVQFGS